MRRRGLAKRIAYATYAPPDWPAAAETMGQLARSQPTRDAILEYLTEPRSVREIALHIDRSRETTGSHLTDMRRRGLIKRVGYGVYALPYSPMPEYPSGSLVRPGTRSAPRSWIPDRAAHRARDRSAHRSFSGDRRTDILPACSRRGLIKRVGYGVYAPRTCRCRQNQWEHRSRRDRVARARDRRRRHALALARY